MIPMAAAMPLLGRRLSEGLRSVERSDFASFQATIHPTSPANDPDPKFIHRFFSFFLYSPVDLGSILIFQGSIPVSVSVSDPPLKLGPEESIHFSIQGPESQFVGLLATSEGIGTIPQTYPNHLQEPVDGNVRSVQTAQDPCLPPCRTPLKGLVIKCIFSLSLSISLETRN